MLRQTTVRFMRVTAELGPTKVFFRRPESMDSVIDGTVCRLETMRGHKVKMDGKLCDIETAKGILEVNTPIDAFISQVYVKGGETIAVDKPLFEIKPLLNCR